jgi:MYXO-CTERM domain-containing protein
VPATPEKKLCFPAYYASDTGGFPTSAPQEDGVSGGDSKGEGSLPPLSGSDNSSNGNSADEDDVATTGSTKSSSSDGGCSVVSAGASSGMSLAWLAVAFVALMRRRRSHLA